MTNQKPRVLLAGESWMIFETHIKGFSSFNTGEYEEGHLPLSKALMDFFDLTYLPNHQANLSFPDTVDELKKFDVILFSDIPSDTLLLHPDTIQRSLIRPNRLRSIQEFVTLGGGFGMIGGYMSFAGIEGKANYRNTPIGELLPVIIDHGDDRIEVPEGFRPKVVNGSHPILQGIPEQWPKLLGYNRFGAKPLGEVLMKIGDDPFLVVGSFGKGRSLAYSSDCSPHWGSPEFVSWNYYTQFWRQLVNWLAGNI